MAQHYYEDFKKHAALAKDEGRIAIGPLVRALFEDDEIHVKEAMRSLMQKREGSPEDQQLIDVVRSYWSFDEGYATLWAIIVLGKMRSEKAIPFLLGVLDSEYDFWKEAVTEALEEIASSHKNAILRQVAEFIEARMGHDPFSARLYAYHPIASLYPDEDAKQFLVWAFENDDTWQESIAHDLALFDDKNILELFKRALAFEQKRGESYLVAELREAYCMLDGDPLDFKRWRREEIRRRENWEERWEYHFSQLGKTEEELETQEQQKTQRIEKFLHDKESEEALAKQEEIRQENARRDAHPIAPFDVGAYLSIRVRGPEEESFAQALALLGLDERWTVELVQEKISEARAPSDVVSAVLEGSKLPNTSSSQAFLSLLSDLWNNTPRAEFQGLTPDEMRDLATEGALNRSLGRNDPCFCGSRKKFKKCHAQK